MNRLITNIELLSDQKSFSLGISNTAENLWFLMHFKKLEILSTVIYRQQYNEFRTSKTKYPKRRLIKKFANTAEFLDYLSSNYRPTKRIFLYEIAFTNGWKIKEQAHIYFTIYTNSLEERNTLINHLINSVGYDPVAIDSLEPNITYYFKASGSLEEYKSDVLPDETTVVTEAPNQVVVNPLTGLPNTDPTTLNRPALVVKIDNHPAARPQMGINQAQMQAGAQQQAAEQNRLNQAYQDWANQQNYPYKQLGFMSDILRGAGQLSTTAGQQMYQAPPSTASQLGGLATAGIGGLMYGLSR